MTAAVVSEAAFQAQVTELAQLTGWRVLHVRRSKVRDDRWATATSIAGWPDLLLWRPGRVVAAELKSDRGQTTLAQVDVLESLHLAGIETFVWRPRDWAEVEQTLRGRL